MSATLFQSDDAVSRSISAGNFTGELGKGGMASEGYGAEAARELGQGWKVSPAVHIDGTSTFTLADIEGPGAIRSMWITGKLTPDRSASEETVCRVKHAT